MINFSGALTTSSSDISKCLNVIVPGINCDPLNVTISDGLIPFIVPKQSTASVTGYLNKY